MRNIFGSLYNFIVLRWGLGLACVENIVELIMGLKSWNMCQFYVVSNMHQISIASEKK